jgi:hypothetical protein
MEEYAACDGGEMKGQGKPTIKEEMLRVIVNLLATAILRGHPDFVSEISAKLDQCL